MRAYRKGKPRFQGGIVCFTWKLKYSFRGGGGGGTNISGVQLLRGRAYSSTEVGRIFATFKAQILNV